MHVLEDTWVRRLQDADTYYTHTSLRDIITHLESHRGGLEQLDFVTLLDKIPLIWLSDPRVLEYINTLEDAHKKAKRIDLPISDNLLAAFATS